MTGHGGWPMTVFLTPDGRPFFGGTYFPPAAAAACRLRRAVPAVDDAWRNRRDDARSSRPASSPRRLDAARACAAGRRPARARACSTRRLRRPAAAQHDAEWGGFGRAPEVPADDEPRAAAARRTPAPASATARGGRPTCLDAMAVGRHLRPPRRRLRPLLGRRASGWCPTSRRCSTTRRCSAGAYLHAWQVTGEARYRQVLDETIGYVLRDLAPARRRLLLGRGRRLRGRGGQVLRLDARRDRRRARRRRRRRRRRVVRRDRRRATSRAQHPPPARCAATCCARPASRGGPRRACSTRARQRVRPGLDDKVLTEWNALLLADAGRGRRRHRRRRLARRRGRQRRVPARRAAPRRRPLAAVAGRPTAAPATSPTPPTTPRWSTPSPAWPRPPARPGGSPRPAPTADALLELFWDDERGGLFTTGHDAEALVARPKDLLDNATPSANALAAVGLLRLAALTGERALPRPGRRHRPAARRPAVARTPPPSPTCWPPSTSRPAASPRSSSPATGPTWSAVVHRRYLPRRRAGLGRALRLAAVGRPPGRPGLRVPGLHVPPGRCRPPTSWPELLSGR